MKDVKKYCVPDQLSYFRIYAVVFIVLYVVGLLTPGKINHRIKISYIGALLWFVFLLIIFIWIYAITVLKPDKIFRKRIKEISLKGKTEIIIKDYKNGKRLFEERMIAGKYSIMGRETGQVWLYSEIDGIYIDRRRASQNQEKPHIKFELKVRNNDCEHTVCEMPEDEKYDADWNTLCEIFGAYASNVDTQLRKEK